MALLKSNFNVSPGDAKFAEVVSSLKTNIANTISALEKATVLPATEQNLAKANRNGSPPDAGAIQSAMARGKTVGAFVWQNDSNTNIFIMTPTSNEYRGAVMLIHEGSHFHPDFIKGGLTHSKPYAGPKDSTGANNPYNFSNFIIAVPVR